MCSSEKGKSKSEEVWQSCIPKVKLVLTQIITEKMAIVCDHCQYFKGS